jgi:DNA replication protein DnaC
MDIRIRPANNNEQQENRRDHSYRVATDKVLTTGIGKRAHNYKFNHIYFEPALQHHVFDRVKDRFRRYDRNLFMVYGQTGAGKTHTMSGGVWKHNGLI